MVLDRDLGLLSVAPSPVASGANPRHQRALDEARSQRVRLQQFLEVLRCSLELPLGQSNDDRFGQLEKPSALASEGRSEPSTSVNCLESVLDFEMERSRDGFGGGPFVRHVLDEL